MEKVSSSDKKEIIVSKRLVIGVLLSFLLSFIIVYVIQNFGSFSYSSDTSKYPNRGSDGRLLMTVYVEPTDRVTLISYESCLGTVVNNYDLSNSELKYQVKDMNYGERFHRYVNKSPYYFQATLKEIKYIIILWVIFSSLIILSSRFRIKLK